MNLVGHNSNLIFLIFLDLAIPYTAKLSREKTFAVFMPVAKIFQ